jgi:exodeoxyribonuclease V alpha subunit
MKIVKIKPDWYLQGCETGWIRLKEIELVRFLESEFGALTESELLITVFLSLFEEDGHVILPLDRSPAKWASILGLNESSSAQLLEGIPGIPEAELESSQLIGKPDEQMPFILDQKKGVQFLAIKRYRTYEDVIHSLTLKKTETNNQIGEPDKVKPILDQLFGHSEEIDWQKTAAALSLIKPFLIISGGPGTGKTTTVARIIALHQKMNNGKLKIGLAAPTGKAAGRMGESLHRELALMDLTDQELSSIPKDAKTIHRLLQKTKERGLLPEAEKKTLHYDLLIVDEASMIDLRLMYRLLTSLDKRTRLILLGDRFQLASVEAGSVFADLCRKTENGFSDKISGTLGSMGGADLPMSDEPGDLTDAIVYLTKSYRFDEDSGIGRLAGYVKEAESIPDIGVEETMRLFEQFEGLEHEDFTFTPQNLKAMAEETVTRLDQSQSIKDPAEMISYWKESAILTCHRRGLEGSERLNVYAEQMIAASRAVQIRDGWYHGRPVMVTRNDYGLGVFNGDAGVCMLDEESGSYRIWVESAGGLKPIQPNRMVHFMPAYFLTVHKSQGSEFDRVSLLLPSQDSPVLTRELLYTAITRARKEFCLLGSINLFLKGILRQTERFTYLGMR